jgi:hypothetical protein
MAQQNSPEHRSEKTDPVAEKGSSRELHRYPETSRYRDVSSSNKLEAGFRDKTRSQPSESDKMRQAGEQIRSEADWMRPEKWRGLDNDQKRIALEHSGRQMSQAFSTPEPPLFLERYRPEAQGSYDDGDYRISMNEAGITQRDKALFGDDPREALNTYTHEFRHSYQKEQSLAYEKNFKTDDSVKAREWAENYQNYAPPPDSKMAETEPARYQKEYQDYHDQPVEKDAMTFADKLVSEVYDH